MLMSVATAVKCQKQTSAPYRLSTNRAEHATNTPRSTRQPASRLAAPTLDSWRVLHIQQRYGIVRLLQIGPIIVRGSSRESLDAWIVHDRLVELHHDRVDQCQDPAVILPRILPRRGLRQAGGDRSIEGHVVFLEWVHGQVVQR